MISLDAVITSESLAVRSEESSGCISHLIRNHQQLPDKQEAEGGKKSIMHERPISCMCETLFNTQDNNGKYCPL